MPVCCAPGRIALLVFAAAVVPRLAVLFAGPWADPERAIFDDSRRHLVLAENLKHYGSFGLADEEPARAWYGVFELRKANGTLPAPDAHGLYPEAFRTPGYPLFILATSAAAGGDVRAALFVQCVFGAFAAVCLYRLGLTLGLGRRAAVAAGLLWALHPGLVDRDCQFMTESLFNSFGVFGLSAAAYGPRGWKGWVLAGACLGFAGLVRPLAALYLPAAGYYAWRRADRRVLAAAVVAAVTLLPSVGWAARNAAVGNGFRVTTVGDMTFFYHFAGYTLSEERGADWQKTWPERAEEQLAALRPRVKPGADVFAEMRALATEELKARPAVAAKVLAKSWVKLYATHSLGEMYRLLGLEYRPTNLMSRYVLGEAAPDEPAPPPADAVLPLAWVGLNLAIAGLALAGTVVGLRRRRFAFVLPLAATVVLFTVATMSQGMERFRSPFMFALFLLAVAPWGLTRHEPARG